MLDEVQSYWQSMTPEMQTALREGSLMVAALVCGHFLGAIAAGVLRAMNFNAALRLPGSTTATPHITHSPGGRGQAEPDADRGLTPTLVAGLLVRLTVWAGAVCWLCHQHGWGEFASGLALWISRTWILSAVVVAAMALGRILAQRLIDCLPDVGKTSAAAQGAASAARWNLAGVVSTCVYVLVVLLALLIAADMFDWPLTRSSALALWQLAQHLLIAGAALFVGCLGARWSQNLVTADAATSPEKRAGQYTSLGIMAATTVLAVAVLLSSAGVLFGLAALAILGFLVWLVRGYLPDVAAGLQLRAGKVREAWFDGVAWQLTSVGLVNTQLCRNGQFCSLQNRVVLEARLHGAPAEAATR
jgi:hypothetical protein